MQRLKKLWVRFWLAGSQFSGRYGKLRQLYAVEDPWNLSSAKERHRFIQSNQQILNCVPRCETLLELGCGEGQQTVFLRQLCDSVTGIDVSDKAIERARLRCPSARFLVGSAEDIETLFAHERFSVVTAFETLYYMPDPALVIAKAKALADVLIVTSYAGRVDRLRPHLCGPGWRQLEPISADGTVWECFVWSR